MILGHSNKSQKFISLNIIHIICPDAHLYEQYSCTMLKTYIYLPAHDILMRRSIN